MADTDTQPLDTTSLTPDQLSALANTILQQRLPNVQPDQTPVDTSGFWGGLRHGISLFGEALGSPDPVALKALSPAEREAAGAQALSRFGTGLLAASHYVPGQTLGSNLAQGFQAAERGYDQTTRQATSMLAARQGYAVEEQQAQLARIKAALPLLTLAQQQRVVGNVPYTVGGERPAPSTSIATGGSIAPFVATNLPAGVTPAEDQIVRTVIGEAGNQGTVGQQAVAAVIKNRMTAGKQGAQDVIFAANQFEPWNNPKTRAGLEAIDPTSKQYQDILNNAVRPVMAGTAKDPTGGATHFYSPTTQKALGRNTPSWAEGQTPTVIGAHNFYKLPYGAQQGPAAPALAPGPQAGVPAPPAPLGGDPRAPVAIPPPVQVAGPGAPTAPPSSPPPVAPAAPPVASPGQTTTEPETGAPVLAPPAAITGPPTFNYNPSPIPPGLIPPGTFTPAQQAALKTIQDAYTHERQVALTPADVQKAESNFGTNMTKVLGSQTDAAKVATDALLKFHEQDFKQQQDTHAKMLDDYLKQQQAEQAQKYKLAEIAATGEQSRQSTAVGAVVNRNNKALEALDVDSKAAAASIPQLEALRALSDNVGDESQGTLTKLATIPFHGTTLLNRMTQLGLADPTKVGPIQMLQGGISGVVAQLRQGMSMGSLSDRDLSFIERLGPSLYEDPTTRSAVISYLQQSQRAKLRFNVEVNKEMTKPNMNIAEAVDNAQRTMETKHPIVPQVPAEIYANRANPDPVWQTRVTKWATDNGVKQNSLVRKPDGYLELIR